MNGLYNIACFLLSMVPMLSFMSASVVLAMYDHPYFAAVSMMFAVFTTPKISLGTENKEKKTYEELKKEVQEFKYP